MSSRSPVADVASSQRPAASARRSLPPRLVGIAYLPWPCLNDLRKRRQSLSAVMLRLISACLEQRRGDSISRAMPGAASGAAGATASGTEKAAFALMPRDASAI